MSKALCFTPSRTLRRNLVALAVSSAFAGNAQSAPTNPTVVSGSAVFSQAGNALNITNTPGTVINWQGFSIGSAEITRFIQQNKLSSVLNRVTGGEASSILGQLLSNGRVFLINPNGVFVGGGAVIDTAGFVASSLRLGDADFLAGRFKFDEMPGAGKVVNQGQIKAGDGGFVYLVAPQVENHGVITSPTGEIVLAAGKSVELVNAQSPYLRVELTAPDNAALNVGQLISQSGKVGIYGTSIRNSGVISANSATVNEQGKIVLKATKDIALESTSNIAANGPKGGSVLVQAEGGTLLADGEIEAKGASDKGGTVQLLGNQVGLIGAASVSVSGDSGGGTVLVGGDFQGKNPAVQNAGRTYVGSGVSIKADATTNGNGGKVVVWAEGDTRYFGDISAKGGAEAGNGGSVEVSGKQVLTYRGFVDTRAVHGAIGSLLLDPTDITISSASSYTGNAASLLAFNPSNASGTGDNIWASGEDAGSQTLGAPDITNILAGSSLTLQASNTITAAVGSSISWGATANTLTLDAGTDITLNDASFTGASGTLSLNGGRQSTFGQCCCD